MKTLLKTVAIAFLSLSFVAANLTADDKPMMKEGVMMKEGKMMMMKDGTSMPMKEEMTMKDGTKVMTDGAVTMKDGKKMKMMEGDMMTMNGMMMKGDMKKDGMK